ncbi:hypothetical protein [Ferrimonas balearica]|uniref:hypothetical protein n=1 Tax=Ferrimonas balearica TaxID=44012 RepID=UPI001C99E221|nr:hypothetical protein [Ferrimonas balearica]MBY5922238.1 hypothetical protein [Ferrimonas balearica]MBY5994422.1 hypothetical protein [Ferrimonas balearica]
MMALILFLGAAVVLALIPVYLGCRILRVGNPSWWGALAAVVAALALQDLAMRYVEDIELAWLASVVLSGFAFSLLLDTSYWRGLVIGIFVLGLQFVVTQVLLNGEPPSEALNNRILAAQEELWPDYH